MLGGSGGGLRRTRSSHPWSLLMRHPWRMKVRRNQPPLPPDVACPPFIRRAASNLRAPSSSEPMRSVLLSLFGRVTRV